MSYYMIQTENKNKKENNKKRRNNKTKQAQTFSGIISLSYH